MRFEVNLPGLSPWASASPPPVGLASPHNPQSPVQYFLTQSVPTNSIHNLAARVYTLWLCTSSITAHIANSMHWKPLSTWNCLARLQSESRMWLQFLQQDHSSLPPPCPQIYEKCLATVAWKRSTALKTRGLAILDGKIQKVHARCRNVSSAQGLLTSFIPAVRNCQRP